VLGGTQSLHTNSYDEALSLPSQHAAELALRTQQIIAYETGVGDTIDPVAGSWYIEHLTDEVERDAEDYVRRIDDMGGALAAVERGFQAQEIHENAFRIQRDIEAHRKIVVGVNEFVDEEPPPTGLHQHDITVGERRKAQLAKLRAGRDAGRVDASMRRLEDAARGDANMVPLLIEAVENYVTLGEICRSLRAVWGEQREATAL
jgi:methylmalonyl-CoA mutase N-terminal domain/subunit